MSERRIVMAMASLIDAINALRRGNNDLCKEKLEQAERTLMRADA